MRILIVGHGVVGKNLEKELEVLHPDVIDKYKPEENKIEVPYGDRYDIAFICVDTPIRKEERRKLLTLFTWLEEIIIPDPMQSLNM